MSKIKIQVSSEHRPLREAIIGYYQNYYRQDFIKVLQYEIENLKSVLIENGVRVYELDPVSGLKDQVTPRDIGFVIGNTFILSSMVEKRRRNEWKGLKKVLEMIDGRIIRAPKSAFIEGGDILINGTEIFVGIGERTNFDGLHFLKGIFENEYDIFPIKINALHLDVVFNIISDDVAIYYPSLIEQLPDIIKNKFLLIKTNSLEYQAMCVNSLSIGNGKILVREGFPRLNKLLQDVGLDIIEIPFTVIPLKWGGIRCTVLPLRRE